MEHKGWHRRGYLPHCDFAGNLQAITFRLADSLPAGAIAAWKAGLQRDLDSTEAAIRRSAESKLFHQISNYEDAGCGSCLLREPVNAAIVQETLIRNHGLHYRLIDWCVMPNHVHVLIKEFELHPLSKVMQGWKGAASREINRVSNRAGRLWMPDYHDRLIRDEDHFYNARAYIRFNPVKAKLCREPRDWRYSSCGSGWEPGDVGKRTD